MINSSGQECDERGRESRAPATNQEFGVLVLRCVCVRVCVRMKNDNNIDDDETRQTRDAMRSTEGSESKKVKQAN